MRTFEFQSSAERKEETGPEIVENLWNHVAEFFFSKGPVRIYHNETIIGVCTGYADDPTYGRIIRVELAEDAGDYIRPAKGVGEDRVSGNPEGGKGAPE